MKQINFLSRLGHALHLAAAAAALVLVLAPSVYADTDWRPYPNGAVGDRADVLACGEGAYIVGFTVKKGAWFDAVGVLCGAVNSTFNGMTPRGPAALPNGMTLLGGPGGGEPESIACKPNEVINGLQVYATNDARRVVVLGLNCSIVSASLTKQPSLNYPSRYISGATPQGWHAEHTQFQACNDYEAAYALDVRWGKDVNAIGLKCRRLERLSAQQPSPPPTPPTPSRPIKTHGDGQGRAVVQTALTAPPEPIVPFGPAPNADPSGPKVGAGGGTAFDMSCPSGQALSGWHYNANASLTALAPYCRTIGQSGESGFVGMVGADDPGARSGAVLCPAATLVRTLRVSLTGAGRVHHIRALCLPLPQSGGHAAVSGGSLTLGGASATDQDASCPGAYATGLVGTYSDGPGGGITSIGLKCHAPKAAPPSSPAAPPPANNPELTVTLSADLYAAKGGEGAPIGVLERDTQKVILLEPCGDNWCHVSWPGHEGWVYSGPDYDSLGLHGGN